MHRYLACVYANINKIATSFNLVYFSPLFSFYLSFSLQTLSSPMLAAIRASFILLLPRLVLEKSFFPSHA